MVLLSRIYTKGGDKGKTSLGNGERVLKSSPRLVAIGSVDELNASVGLIVSHLKTDTVAHLSKPILDDLTILLQSLQNDLFDVGGDLCFPEDAKPDYALMIKGSYIERLEKWIDHYNADLPELRSFVLPGGSPTSAFLHLSRTIARRAERDICALMQVELINSEVFMYMNRLSDLLFVLSRFVNHQGDGDILWRPGGEDLDKTA